MRLEGRVEELFQQFCRAPTLPAPERRSGPWLEEDAVEALLPHRAPFRFVDRITHVARPSSPNEPLARVKAGMPEGMTADMPATMPEGMPEGLPEGFPEGMTEGMTEEMTEGIIVCRYDLRRAAPILAGHFPGRPLWPGVLQVEAVGQAGLCLFRLLAAGAEATPSCLLTDVLAGRCLRPVVPDGEVEIVARVLRDGLFIVVVGQCLKDGLVCSAAAVRGIEEV